MVLTATVTPPQTVVVSLAFDTAGGTLDAQDSIPASVMCVARPCSSPGCPASLLHRVFFDRPQLVTGADLMALDPTLDWAKLKQGRLQLRDHGLLILVDHSD